MWVFAYFTCIKQFLRQDLVKQSATLTDGAFRVLGSGDLFVDIVCKVQTAIIIVPVPITKSQKSTLLLMFQML